MSLALRDQHHRERLRGFSVLLSVWQCDDWSGDPGSFGRRGTSATEPATGHKVIGDSQGRDTDDSLA